MHVALENNYWHKTFHLLNKGWVTKLPMFEKNRTGRWKRHLREANNILDAEVIWLLISKLEGRVLGWLKYDLKSYCGWGIRAAAGEECRYFGAERSSHMWQTGLLSVLILFRSKDIECQPEQRRLHQCGGLFSTLREVSTLLLTIAVHRIQVQKL